MASGTITLTNNSDAVAGVGTAFLTDLAAGDFIVANVGGIAYTLPVKAISSATALTIISKFTGPTLGGLAWFVVKREQQAMITAALVVQSTEALRVLNYDKSNWQQVFSAAGDITVTMPDGTQFTGPSWQKIVTLLAASDIEAIQPLVDQVRADAQQVAADKTTVQTAKTDVVAAKDAAQTASSTASIAKTDAVAAKDTAVSAAGSATSQATAAEASAVRAEAAAGILDGSIYLQKTDNLASVSDKSAARGHLEVYSTTEVDDAIAAAGAGGSGIPLGFRYNHSNRAKLNAGTAVLDGQVVQIAGSFSDLADHAEANEPTTTEADWQANPGKRNCFVINRTAGTMRMPDMNGVQSGSFGPTYQSGDGGTIAAGTMTQNAAPNITGSAAFFNTAAGNISATGSLKVTNGASSEYTGNAANTRAAANLAIDAGLSSGSYGRDGATRVKPDTAHGVWVIQYANAAQNEGQIDALAIDTDLQNFKTSQQARYEQQQATNAQLQAKNVQIEGRIGYALVTTTANPALNTRTVFTNPFGASTPVICITEVFHATLQKWLTTHVIYASSQSYGTAAHYSEGEGIVLRTGSAAFASNFACGNQETTANYTTPSPFRIHVFKVTA